MTKLFRRTTAPLARLDHGSEVATLEAAGPDTDRTLAAMDRERRAARDAERRLSAVLLDAPQPLVAVDGSGRVREANRRAQDLLGCSRPDALGTLIGDFLTSDSAQTLERLIARYVATAEAGLLGSPIRVEVRSRTGAVTVVEASIGAMDDASGVLFHIFFTPVAEVSRTERSALTILAEVAAIISEADDERSMHAVRNAAVYLAGATDAALCDADVEALHNGSGATLSWPVPGGGTLAVHWDDPAADPPATVREALAALAGIAAPALARAAR